MYRERFGFATEPSSENVVLGVQEYPQGIVKYDPTFDKDLEVYHDQVTIRLPLKPGVAQPFTLLVSGQGCADAGLCYPPMTKEIKLTPVAGGYQAQGPGVVASVPPPRSQAELAAVAESGGAGKAGLGSALQLGDTGFAAYLADARSEEHTSELQSLMRISYA